MGCGADRDCPFRPELLGDLPEPARRYLTHAIAPGTPMASAVRLRMYGEIKLSGWCPFRAEQVICADRGMIWKATVYRGGLPILGSDRLVDGMEALRCKLFGLIPMMTADGADIARSTAGRLHAESLWLPSLLLGAGVNWATKEGQTAQVHLDRFGYCSTVTLTLQPDGTGSAPPELANFDFP